MKLQYFLSRLNSLLCAFILCASSLYAQKYEEIELKLSQTVYLDRRDPVTQGFFMHFPNLQKRKIVRHNKIVEYEAFYYYNPKELKKIKEAEEQKNYDELDRLLFNYIKNFGIKNFKLDVDLIWKYAQLMEMKNDTVKALYFYNLALKNHSKYYDPVKLHFDRLKEKVKSEYVDLDLYYKIVQARAKIDTLIPPKGVLLKMGDNINSIYPEYAPFMHPNNKLMIFTSKRSPMAMIAGVDFEQHEDIYFVKEDYEFGGWTIAEKFPDEINSRFNEGSACINKEGNLLIFSRCNAPDGYGICDLYSAEFIDGKWQNVKNLGPNVNTPHWESHPNLSPDGKTLYFSSNRGDGFGRCDIWKSELLPNGEWGKAENLGPTINTIEDEVSPYFHSINNTLYFSSTGHLHSFGGFDIFKSRWLDNHFEEPRNLGPLVNTPKDEYYFAIDGKGEKIFYAHQQEKPANNFDIFSFPMPMGARPDAITTLSGYLIDSATKQPLKGVIIAIDLEKGIEIEPKILNPYGYFEFELINQRKYQLLVIGDHLLRIKEQKPLDADSNFYLVAQAVKSQKPLVFDGLEFEKNKADISQDIAYKLDYLVEFLKKYPFCRIKISGHTDAEGDDEYNFKLSIQRAENIKEYILEHTEIIDDQIITTQGFGETQPLYPNDTEENKRKNRRVEFEITIDPAYKDQFLAPYLPSMPDTSSRIKIQIGIDKEYDLFSDEEEEEMEKEQQIKNSAANDSLQNNQNLTPNENAQDDDTEWDESDIVTLSDEDEVPKNEDDYENDAEGIQESEDIQEDDHVDDHEDDHEDDHIDLLHDEDLNPENEQEDFSSEIDDLEDEDVVLEE